MYKDLVHEWLNKILSIEDQVRDLLLEIWYFCIVHACKLHVHCNHRNSPNSTVAFSLCMRPVSVISRKFYFLKRTKRMYIYIFTFKDDFQSVLHSLSTLMFINIMSELMSFVTNHTHCTCTLHNVSLKPFIFFFQQLH